MADIKISLATEDIKKYAADEWAKAQEYADMHDCFKRIADIAAECAARYAIVAEERVMLGEIEEE